MFIRKINKIDSKSGKTYTAYYLVESIRTDKGPRQKVMLYMGSEINLPETEHKLLAKRISEIIIDVKPLIPCPEAVEQLAQVYASQVIHRLSETIASSETSANPPPEEHFVTVDANTIEKSEPRSVGTEHLLLKMSQQLQLQDKLQKLGFSATEISIALGSIIARAARPRSELATYNWLCKQSGVGELLDFNFNKISHNRLYWISDKLLVHKDALEKHFEEVERKSHGYQTTLALYDLTNTYMEGQAKSNPKAQHGVSKEKRKDCPLVTLGLVMNEYGFLNRTSILPGNASEPKTLQEMIKNLTAHESLFKPTIILDAGISTEENLQWLRKNQYTYIVSARQNAPSIELEGELVSVGDLNGLVKAALVKDTTSSEERWLYCESEAKASVAAKMKQSFRKRFEDDLQKLANGLTKPRGRKKYIKVLERVGRLKEKHKQISGCYEIIVTPTEDGINATSVGWKIIDEKMSEKLKGTYFLRTNITKMDPKGLWQLYNVLRGVEDAFRFMKSSLGLRPVYHQKEYRVDGHLWITVIAYHLIQNCLYQLEKEGITQQWETIRTTMNSRMRVTMEAKTKEGKMLYHRSTTKAEGEQVDIYQALKLSPQILKSKKIIL